MADEAPGPIYSSTFHLFAAYHQFYLQDEDADGDTPEDWGQLLARHMIAVAPRKVGIGTARNMTVPVQVELLPARPVDAFDDWDHVAEASLDVPSGWIVIAGCIDYLPDAQRFSVPTGSYRVRVYAGGLDTLSEDGLQGEDHYHVHLWLEQYQPTRILKR